MVLLAVAVLPSAAHRASAQDLDRTGTIWGPYIEWALENPSYPGNPYDLEAEVTFRHPSGRTHTTPMFYDGGGTWKFRFTGTELGTWTFTTSSSDPDLDGRSGTVVVRENDDPNMKGFVAGRFVNEDNGSRWVRTATGEAFIPQYVMYHLPEDPAAIDADIETFLHGHGFTGFHIPVLCRWFDLDSLACDRLGAADRDGPVSALLETVDTEACRRLGVGCPSPNPDHRTFEILEAIITKTYAAGGVVHLWVWGDEERRQTPYSIGGLNGEADQRLQRYIAARLGPLPGWTMGYGFDLFEWVERDELRTWHASMHRLMGWPHMLGGRPGGPRRGTDHSGQYIYEGLDYASYEHHRPTYEVYAAALQHLPHLPSFSEDRFRVRQGYTLHDKDFDHEMTRRTMWHSAMAGGVANIWGRVDADQAINRGQMRSKEYDNKELLKTYSRFFDGRFLPDMVRDNGLTDGRALRSGTTHYLFHKEDAASVRMDLRGMAGPQPAVAIDAKRPYREVEIGPLEPRDQVWRAPYESDWAIAVGDFGSAGLRS